MKFSCSRNLLADGIFYVQKAIASRTPSSVTNGILLEIEDSIRLTGYDMEQCIQYTLPADIQRKGKVVIEASFLGEIIRKCTEDTVYFSCDDKYAVEISCGKAHFQLKGITAESYPKIVEENKEKSFTMPQFILKNLIRQTIFSISQDVTRKNLMGCFFLIKKDTIDIISIDGFRMAVRHYAEEGYTFSEGQFIVLGKHLRDLMSILGDVGDVKVSFNNSQISFDLGNLTLSSRLIQENFLNYQAIIPSNYKTNMIVRTKDLLDSIERAMLVSTADRRYPVKLVCKDNKLEISATSIKGTMKEEIEIRSTGEEMDIDFNPRYLYDVLRILETENVILKFAGEMSPVVMIPEEGDSYLYLILPLRR